jgi:hypothetical protein
VTYQPPADWQPQVPPPDWQPQVPPPAGYGGPPPPGGYLPSGYPAPPPAYTPYGYPQPSPRGARVSPPWTGAVLAGAGLVAGIGSFLTWARIVVAGANQDIAGTDGQRDGKITVVLGAVLLAVGIVILVKQGRLWTSIVGIVLSAICALVALADIGDISDKSATIKPFGHIDVGVGLVLVLVAALVGLGASIVAISIRRVLTS